MQPLDFPFRTDQFAPLIGGEIEEINPSRGIFHRGHIADIRVAEEDGTGTLHVQPAWMVRATGAPGSPLPSGPWEEIQPDSWALTLWTMLGEGEGTPTPLVMPANSSGRIIIDATRLFDIIVTLFPPDGSKLRHDNVNWLPGGPAQQWFVEHGA